MILNVRLSRSKQSPFSSWIEYPANHSATANHIRYGVVANISRSHNLRDQFRGAQGSIPCTGDAFSFLPWPISTCRPSLVAGNLLSTCHNHQQTALVWRTTLLCSLFTEDIYSSYLICFWYTLSGMQCRLPEPPFASKLHDLTMSPTLMNMSTLAQWQTRFHSSQLRNALHARLTCISYPRQPVKHLQTCPYPQYSHRHP